MWLAVQGKLLTRDRLANWGVEVHDDQCALCGMARETIDHLFFKCQFSAELCYLGADWLKFRMIPTRRGEWHHWLGHISMQSPVWCRIWNLGVVVVVAMLWRERNARIFAHKRKTVMQLFFKLKHEVTVRALGCVMGCANEQLVRDILQV